MQELKNTVIENLKKAKKEKYYLSTKDIVDIVSRSFDQPAGPDLPDLPSLPLEEEESNNL